MGLAMNVTLEDHIEQRLATLYCDQIIAIPIDTSAYDSDTVAETLKKYSGGWNIQPHPWVPPYTSYLFYPR
jgi:hypothetical protein